MKFLRSTALAALLGAAAVGASAEETLIVGTVNTPSNLNGAIQSGIATAMVSTQIFASPLRYDANWNPQPYLAESWETSEDGLTVTLHLVEGATFHDGTPVTAEDVAFSIETVKENHPFTTMLAPVTSVDTPDDRTVVIHLSHPHPALLLAMSPVFLPVLPEHIYGEGPIRENPANLAPIGSGPFKFVEYTKGEVIRLEKNEDFFLEGYPKLDKVIFQIFSDEPNLTLAMERGDVDYAPFLSDVRTIQRLDKAEGVSITTEGGDGIGPINWLAFNTKRAPYDDKRVRQAIGYAINKDFYLNRLLGGYAHDQTGPIINSSPLSTDDVNHYDFDLAKAEELLDEAGLVPDADGTRFTMVVDYSPGSVDTGRNFVEYLRSQLRQIGIDVEARPSPDFPTWAQRVGNWDFDVTQDAVFNWGDPVIGVNRTYMSDNIRKGVIWSNTQQYSNPKVDELLTAAATETDPAKRAALYAEFQKIVVEDAPVIFLSDLPYTEAYKDGLEGLPTTIWGPAAPWDQMHWAE
ncbi:ABC transporter substrate-binding protein [Falsirhodobacter algicola]|uniref:ABC transporter substrate-binding protein n=1 Tax=Falsirhodobacter algicola TaxID=2692330 RepID=A0A8J8MU88_9RHOB|nr:ABC transporter substrate-binding protein [Falsirhodobacter algicola]QUS36318.1 ABC transporter substrate-binding protein [Falsirhodobacter algicola]